MRRLLSIAVVGAAALLPLSVHAQMRGSFRGPAPRMSSGFHSAPFGGARSFAPPPGRVFMRGPVARPGGRVFMGRPFTPGAARTRFTTSGTRFSFNGFARSCGGFFPCHNRAFFRHRFHDRFLFSFGSPFFGFGSPFFPGFVSASYIPGFFPEDYYGGYSPYAYQQPPETASSDNGADIQLAQQIQRLSDEVEDLRDQQASAQREAREPAPPGTSMSVVNPAVATTFVFRDGHRVTAQNYAIAGETLWILNEHAAKKVPLSDIDVAATQQVNAANGVDVRLPSSAQKK